MESLLKFNNEKSASLVMISSDDLVTAMTNLYVTARQDAIQQILSQSSQNSEDKELVSAKQARLLLKKSQNTLWKWAKRGYLVPVKVGGTLMYKMSDLNKIMGL